MNIKKVVQKHGIENIIVIAQLRPLRSALGLLTYTSSNDEPVAVHCKIVEDRYAINNRYKIEIEPLVNGYGKKSYYQSDFESLADRGHIHVLVDVTKVPHDTQG